MTTPTPEYVLKRHPAKVVAVVLFAAGLVVAVLLWLRPETRGLYAALHAAGYAGAVVAGVLYGASLTAGLATIVFATLPPGLHPLLAALAGGVGAVAYDLAVFALVRREARDPFRTLMDRLQRRPRLPSWVALSLGCVILASPLPDELAAGWFGLSSLPARRFIPLSFALNAAGLLVIALLG